MFRYMPPIALLLWATCSNSAIKNSDFWFHDEGDTIFIDGTRGAPLHIDYIGAPLTKPLTVRVTPENPQLKVTPPTCTFTKKDDDCRLTVRLENGKQKVYGVNQFTVSETGGSAGVLNVKVTADTSTVGFGVGVQAKDMPAVISWQESGPGPVIVANSTGQARDYQTTLLDQKPVQSSPYIKANKITTPIFSLPSEQICYIDENLFSSPDPSSLLFPVSDTFFGIDYNYGYLSDVTNPSDPIYNGIFITNNKNITTCSANGKSECASNKWDSWTVGLANLSTQDLDSNVFKAGQIQILQNNTWNNGTTLYYKALWKDLNPCSTNPKPLVPAFLSFFPPSA